MAVVTLKQGDTTPEFSEELDGLAQELTGDETIRFYMEHEDSGDLIINQPVTAVDYAQNEITYDFSTGETSRQGTHFAEVVVTYGDGEVQSLPASDYWEVDIAEPTNRDVPPADLDAPDITVGVVDASEVRAPTLSAVETLTGSITGGQTLSSLAGPNLSIQNGELTAGDVQESANHFNTTYDSNEDGVIDADVDNALTITDELSVGSGPSITAVAGDSGDFIHRKTVSFPNSYTTTSTTYDTYFGEGYLVNEASLETTNATDIYISGTAKISNDTAGETTTFSIRSQGNTYTEMSGTATSSSNTILKFSGIVDYANASTANAQLYPQIKVSGGAGGVQSVSVDFWVKVGT